jgi:hypothetical protein
MVFRSDFLTLEMRNIFDTAAKVDGCQKGTKVGVDWFWIFLPTQTQELSDWILLKKIKLS